MVTNVSFHCASPIFRVNDLSKSILYYQEKLNFSIDWYSDNIIASISRQKANLMLCEEDQGKGQAWIYIGVSSVEELFEELKKNDVIIRQTPTNFPWALEMQVEDLDKNIIRFGSESLIGKPFGSWLDMDGKLCNYAL